MIVEDLFQDILEVEKVAKLFQFVINLTFLFLKYNSSDFMLEPYKIDCHSVISYVT